MFAWNMSAIKGDGNILFHKNGQVGLYFEIANSKNAGILREYSLAFQQSAYRQYGEIAFLVKRQIGQVLWAEIENMRR